MSNQPAAPVEAGTLAPWAQAIAHARIPAALKLLLLALIAAFGEAGTARHRLRLPRQDWFIAANAPAGEESPLTWNELRRLRRARAELGWLLRGKPNRGMRLSGHRAPVPSPPRAARAPPLRSRTPPTPRIRRENPAPRGDDSCPNAGTPPRPARCSSMSDRRDPPPPELTPAPGTGRAVRQGRISGRVVTVLLVSVVLAVVLMAASWFLW